MDFVADDLLAALAPVPARAPDEVRADYKGSYGVLADDTVNAAADVVLLVHFVESRLPWRSQSTKEPVGMAVLDAGLLERDHYLHPAGTPYVVVGVDSWAAAEAVEEALHDVARLTENAWVIGWTRTKDAFRAVHLFPTIEAAGRQAYG